MGTPVNRMCKSLGCNDLQLFCEKSSSWRFFGKHLAGSSVYTYWHVRYALHLLTALSQFGCVDESVSDVRRHTECAYCLGRSLQAGEIDPWLTGTPDFAPGVNQRGRAEPENTRLFVAQVDTSRENLSTRRKWWTGLELEPRKGRK